MRHFAYPFFSPSSAALSFGFWIIPLLTWSLIWKGISLWKAGRNNQPYWFTALLVFNTLGILPIIYLLFFQASPPPTPHQKKSSSKSKKSQSK